MSDCPFCDYQGPSEIAYEDEHVYGIEPLDPVTLGHKLLIPKRHVEHFAEAPEVTAQVAKVAAQIAPYGDCNLITSKGPSATQTVRHLHFHIVPRHEGDGLHLPWTSPYRDVLDQLNALGRRDFHDPDETVKGPISVYGPFWLATNELLASIASDEGKTIQEVLRSADEDGRYGSAKADDG